MKRREALQKTSWIVKSALFAPPLLTALQSCRQQPPPKLLVLTPKQDALVDAISNTIIPPTDTPGASDVKVSKFIDLLLADAFEEQPRQQFLAGLSTFDQACQGASGSSFTTLNTGDQLEYLTKVDQEIMGQSYTDHVPFYYSMKHLTTQVYFSTEVGMTQNLNYQPVPGSYQGVIPYAPGDKIIVGNNM